MAEKRTLARPYAKAVFEIAEESQSLQSWSAALNILSIAIQNDSVIELLKNEAIDLEKIVLFLNDICQGNLDKTTLQNFIRILALKKRLPVLPEIAILYEAMRNEAQKIIPVQVTASHTLNDTQKETIEKHLSQYFQCSLKMDFEINPQLLGGFIARAGNYVIDNSVRGFLGNLKIAMGDQSWV